MFSHLKPLPIDPILGLGEEFSKDPRADKINLTVGVYADDAGKPTVFKAVQHAEEHILREHRSKSYLPMKGPKHTLDLIARHVLGEGSDQVIASYGSGGTGALRLAAEVMNMTGLKQRIWISTPTWETHNTPFKHCQFDVLIYPWVS